MITKFGARGCLARACVTISKVFWAILQRQMVLSFCRNVRWRLVLGRCGLDRGHGLCFNLGWSERRHSGRSKKWLYLNISDYEANCED